MGSLESQDRLMRSGIDVSRLGERIRLVLRKFLRFLVRRYPPIRAAYISQNQIASKVHSPDSPSASKKIGRDTPSTMQALVSATKCNRFKCNRTKCCRSFSQFFKPLYEFSHFEEV